MPQPKSYEAYKNSEGKRVPSVTTILGRFDDKNGLIEWAARLAREGKDHRQVSRESKNIGDLVHSWIESVIKGESLTTPDDVPPEAHEQASRAFNAFANWYHENVTPGLINFRHIEYKMVSEALQVGARTDAIIEYSDGDLGILDFKTSNSFFNGGSGVLLQGAAYALIYEELNPGSVVNRIVALRLDKDSGEFEEKRWDGEPVATAKRLVSTLVATYRELIGFERGV